MLDDRASAGPARLPRSAGERGDPRLDASKGSGSKFGLGGGGRGDDGARNFVQPLLDQREGFAAPAVVLLAHEMLDGAGKRADLVLQRAQRQ